MYLDRGDTLTDCDSKVRMISDELAHARADVHVDCLTLADSRIACPGAPISR